MRNRSGLLALGAIVLALSGCGDQVSQRVLDRLSGGPPGLNPEEMQRLVASGANRMILRMPKHATNSLFYEAGGRDGVRRWRSLDNVQIYTRDGQIIGVRGLSDDLMTADIGTAGLIAAGRAGQDIRIHRVLDGQDRLEIRSYVCDVRPVGQERIQVDETKWMDILRVDETCHSPRGEMTNRHWVANGRVIRSITTYSGFVGPVEIVFMP